MAAKIVKLRCKDCGEFIGAAVVPDAKQLGEMIPLKFRAILSLLPDVNSLPDVAVNLPLLCKRCGVSRGLIKGEENG